MIRSTHSYILILLISLLFIACHSNSQVASARPNKVSLIEPPVNTPVRPLAYDTTAPQVKKIIAELDKFYFTQARFGFNGSVLVGYKGKIIYERCFGLSNREQKLPLTPNSSCQLASITKTFTGAAALYLYQRKHLDIDKPVQFYINDFPYPAITVRMMLDHRSGLPDYTKWVPNYNKDMNTPINNDEMLRLMALHKPRLEFKPNTRFTYSNTNFAVLAKVIEVVSGMTYSDFMTTYIFHPLGMMHTFVYKPGAPLPQGTAISYRYNWVREPDMFADGVCGDKGIYSTPEDMYRWDQSFYNNTLLDNPTIELSYGPCSFERPGVKNYGLGWRMLCYPNGNKIIYHNGWWHGNNTSFYRLIKDNFTIVVLGNKFNKSIYRHAAAICDVVRGSSTENNFDSEE
ncbi:MAG: beta-lactamase family protein [Taibaiella sp.]|nr:beta-lactamase family protein [Taibaiella sp.]